MDLTLAAPLLAEHVTALIDTATTVTRTARADDRAFELIPRQSA
jgi:hypothetical protein